MCRECSYKIDSMGDLLFSEHASEVATLPSSVTELGMCPNCGVVGRFRVIRVEDTGWS